MDPVFYTSLDLFTFILSFSRRQKHVCFKNMFVLASHLWETAKTGIRECCL